jgi:hypothetical protein
MLVDIGPLHKLIQLKACHLDYGCRETAEEASIKQKGVQLSLVFTTKQVIHKD